MNSKIEFGILDNPRKDNNDLGDYKCDMCGEKSSKYLKITIYKHTARFCKGCLLNGVSMIDRSILKTKLEK